MQLKKTIQNNLFPFIVFMILVAGCCLGWYFFHPSSPYHARYSFVVSYQQIGTLSPGNRVVVRGIEKGQILKVELTDDAVFVKVEVLADAKISKHSEFRLINAGLMGEREMNILTADDGDWIVDGDTVFGAYDDGITGVGNVLISAIKDLDEMKDVILALKDSLTIGTSGKRIDRIVKKGKKLVKAGGNLVSDARDEALAALEKGEGTLQKARAAIEDASNRARRYPAQPRKGTQDRCRCPGRPARREGQHCGAALLGQGKVHRRTGPARKGHRRTDQEHQEIRA